MSEGAGVFFTVLSPFHWDFGLVVFTAMLAVVVGTALSIRSARTRFCLIELDPLAEDGPALSKADDKFAEAAPALLISLGLLGTFVGLAVAIDLAGDVLRESSQLHVTGDQVGRLSTMLAGIGLKFKTSAWGLIGAIALRPFVYRGITRPRYELQCSIDRALRAASETRHSKRSRAQIDPLRIAANKQVELLEQVVTLLAQQQATMAGFDGVSQGLRVGASSLQQSARDLRTSVGELRSANDRSHQALQGTFTQGITTFTEKVNETMTLVGVQVAGIQASVEPLERTIVSLKQLVDHTTGELKNASISSANTLAASAQQLTRTLGTALEEMRRGMEQTTTDNTNKMGAALEGMSVRLGQSVTDLSAALRLMTAEAQQAREDRTAMAGTLKEVASRIEAIASGFGAARRVRDDETGNAVTALKGVIEDKVVPRLQSAEQAGKLTEFLHAISETLLRIEDTSSRPPQPSEVTLWREPDNSDGAPIAAATAGSERV